MSDNIITIRTTSPLRPKDGAARTFIRRLKVIHAQRETQAGPVLVLVKETGHKDGQP